jgi:imidazolonepropionase-like amidohydrolase
MDEESGSLAEGTWADVVLNADRANLRALVTPALVIQAGRIVHDARLPRQATAELD